MLSSGFSSVHCVLWWGAKNYQNNDSWDIFSFFFYWLGCFVEGSYTRLGRESKSSLSNLRPSVTTVSPKHPIRDSMWSSHVCNALNSGMKLAVLQQTSNTLIIDDSLWGAAALSLSLSHCKLNEERVRKKEGEEPENGEGEFCSTSNVQNGRRKTRRHLDSGRRAKWCRAEAQGWWDLTQQRCEELKLWRANWKEGKKRTRWPLSHP